MSTHEQRIADLEQQVADLAERVEQLASQAFVFRTVEQMRYDAGCPGGVLQAAFEARRVSAGGEVTPRPAAQRPRHLHAVSGGQQ